jgi:hypothetical protein
METFTQAKPLIDNPHFAWQRKVALASLDMNTIDIPIRDIIKGFREIPCCFTIQSCFGHFLYSGRQDRFNTEPLPPSDSTAPVTYCIAYIALCIENNSEGKELLESLRAVTSIDRNYIQFGSADWFWVRQANSYALQVEPDRFKYQDQAVIDYQEALHIEKIRNSFYSQLRKLLFK